MEERPRFKTIGLTSLLAFISVIAAVLCFTASADAAIGVQSFSLTPSTTTQGANPDLSLAATRSGADGDDLKLTNLKLPTGLNYSVAAATKCSSADFSADNCPAASVVGTASATGKLQLYGYDLLTGSAAGTVYALSNTQIGTIYRPDWISSFFVKSTISGTPATGITLASGDFPRTANIFGLFPVDLTIAGLGYAYYGKSGATKTGPVVVTNPTTCGAATSTLGFTAYNGSTASKTSAFTVTGCGPTGPTGPADTTKPVISGITPATGFTTTNASVVLTYTATDNSGVAPTCTPASGSTINLALGANPITITCTDGAGNSQTASVTYTRNSPPDTTNPVISGITPANGFSTTNSSVVLTYTATDNSGVAPTCTPASGSTINLVLGSNPVTITCTDGAGNAATANVSYTRTAVPDTTKPVISAISPATGFTTTNATVVITYTATDNSGVAPTCTPASGSTINLALGANPITITCTDGAGNSQTASVTYTRNSPPDTTNPVISAITPANGFSTTNSSVVLTYTATDNSGVAPTCTPASGSTINLVIGSNPVTITCTDGAGNAATASLTYTRTAVPDTTKPVISAISPATGFTTTNATVVLTYTATDNSGVAPTCTPASGSTINLVLGSNPVTITCTDGAGNAATANVTYTRTAIPDTTKPVISAISPATGFTTTNATVVITYTATDNSGVAPTCTPASGSTINLTLGANPITITCTDAAGNSQTASVTYTRNSPPDTTNPVISGITPANGFTTTNASVVLTYTATDNSGVAPTCTPASGSTINLVVGSNPVTITCTDGAGNAATANVTYTRQDNTPLPPTSAPPITVKGAPSALSTAPGTFTFTAPAGATSNECRYNGGTWGACTSPAPTTNASVKIASTDAAAPNFTVPNSGENTYEVRGVNAGGAGPIAKGFIWIDDRAYTAKTQIGSSDYGAGKNPAAVSGRIDLQGYDDPKSLEASLPDGMSGSLSAVPVASRCTLTLAKAGNCPASALIGQAVVSASSPTDGEVTATGNVYIINAGSGADAINPRYAAGAAVVFKNIAGTVTPNLGDVVGLGGLELTDQGRQQHLIVSANTTPGSNAASSAQTSQYGSQLFTGQTDQQALPNQTSTGNRFHVKQVKLLTLFGTTGAHTVDGFGNALATPVTTTYSSPLIYNAHACINTAQTARPFRQQFRGTAIGYNGSTFAAPATAPYVPTDCASQLFTPTVNYTLSSSAAGTGSSGVTPVALTANINFPAGNQSSMKALWLALPPYLGILTENIGTDANQCEPTASVNVSPAGTTPAWQTFRYTAAQCPPEARVGTMTLNSPLVPTPIIGQVYFLGGGAVPNIGVKFDSSTPGNIQGLDNLGLYGGTSTVEYPEVLASGGTTCSQDTLDAQPDAICQTALQTAFTNIPDIPLSSATVVIGDNATRTDHNTGTPLGQYVLKLANHSSSTCNPDRDNNFVTRMLPYSNANVSTSSTITFGAQRKLQTPVPITGCDPQP